MTADFALFDMEPAEQPSPSMPAAVKLSEREMLDLLHDRYGFVSSNGGSAKPRWVCAEHVRAVSGFFDAGDLHGRTLDFVAVDTWRSGNLATHGAEVKVSRSDWLRELKDPRKSAPFLEWVTHFWLAVPGPAIVRTDELPPGWGLLVARMREGRLRLRAETPAAARDVPGIPPETLASLLYAVQKTATARARALATEAEGGRT